MELARPRTIGNARVAALVEVASRCEKEIDPNRPPQFDLATEEVEKGNPDLVIRDLTPSRCTKLKTTSTAQILRERIAYAKQRWGCTLFYVDSTATVYGSINPDVFKAVADAYPDILLIPENESMRYFAYSAPLNSYMHHQITSTPVGALGLSEGV